MIWNNSLLLYSNLNLFNKVLICIIRIVQTRNENFFQVRSPLENVFHFQNNKVNYILVDINSLTSHTLEFLAHEKKRLDKNHHSFFLFYLWNTLVHVLNNKELCLTMTLISNSDWSETNKYSRIVNSWFNHLLFMNKLQFIHLHTI